MLTRSIAVPIFFDTRLLVYVLYTINYDTLIYTFCHDLYKVRSHRRL